MTRKERSREYHYINPGDECGLMGRWQTIIKASTRSSRIYKIYHIYESLKHACTTVSKTQYGYPQYPHLGQGHEGTQHVVSWLYTPIFQIWYACMSKQKKVTAKTQICTDNGQMHRLSDRQTKAIRKAHLNFQLRWAKRKHILFPFCRCLWNLKLYSYWAYAYVKIYLIF